MILRSMFMNYRKLSFYLQQDLPLHSPPLLEKKQVLRGITHTSEARSGYLVSLSKNWKS